jgi:hypothetical protein
MFNCYEDRVSLSTVQVSMSILVFWIRIRSLSYLWPQETGSATIWSTNCTGLTVSAVLGWLSLPGCASPVVLSRLSNPDSLVPTVLLHLSCRYYHVLAVLFSLS